MRISYETRIQQLHTELENQKEENAHLQRQMADLKGSHAISKTVTIFAVSFGKFIA